MVSCVEYVDLYAEETQESHTFGVLISQPLSGPKLKVFQRLGPRSGAKKSLKYFAHPSPKFYMG